MTVEITAMRVTVVRGCSWEGLHAAHGAVLVGGVGYSREFLMDSLRLSISHLCDHLNPHIRGPVTSLLCSVFVELLHCLHPNFSLIAVAGVEMFVEYIASAMINGRGRFYFLRVSGCQYLGTSRTHLQQAWWELF